MLIKLIPKIGTAPIVIDVAQFIVFQENGTPIAVGAEYGPQGTQSLSIAGNPDFNRILKALGVNTTVIVDTLQLPQPQPGAKLITHG